MTELPFETFATAPILLAFENTPAQTVLLSVILVLIIIKIGSNEMSIKSGLNQRAMIIANQRSTTNGS